jgi:hypothetical protein
VDAAAFGMVEHVKPDRSSDEVAHTVDGTGVAPIRGGSEGPLQATASTGPGAPQPGRSTPRVERAGCGWAALC